MGEQMEKETESQAYNICINKFLFLIWKTFTLTHLLSLLLWYVEYDWQILWILLTYIYVTFVKNK
jgi:hypothetical protein